jgi:hypothetical protein
MTRKAMFHGWVGWQAIHGCRYGRHGLTVTFEVHLALCCNIERTVPFTACEPCGNVHSRCFRRHEIAYRVAGSVHESVRGGSRRWSTRGRERRPTTQEVLPCDLSKGSF